MQLPTASIFNRKSIETVLKRENKFVSELLSLLPVRIASSQPDDVLLENSSNVGAKQHSLKIPNKIKSRAKSLVELQARLKQMSKKGLSYKEKLLKKNIKAKLKKKNRRSKDDIKQPKKGSETKSELNAGVSEQPSTSVTTNHKGAMVFSKFDFAELGKKKERKERQDSQQLLNSLQKQKEKLNKLNTSGEVEKAIEIKEKFAWKNAIAKAQGEKIKDDEQLLIKTIKREKQQRKKSKKKWDARQEGVKKAKDERQQKRQENIDKRKKTKKLNKMKKAAKRGRIVPGM